MATIATAGLASVRTPTPIAPLREELTLHAGPTRWDAKDASVIAARIARETAMCMTSYWLLRAVRVNRLRNPRRCLLLGRSCMSRKTFQAWIGHVMGSHPLVRFAGITRHCESRHAHA